MNERFAYLVKVDVENNRNAYIRMIADQDIFHIEQGRVGATSFKRKRPVSVWGETYDQYIRNGYIDQTEMLNVFVKRESKYKEIEDGNVRCFIRYIMQAANKLLEEKYTVSYDDVTDKMIVKAQELICKMSIKPELRLVNSLLPELFKVIPRKMKNVEDELAHCPEEVNQVIEREQELLNIMVTKVNQTKREDTSEGKTILEVHGLEVSEVTDKAEIDKIKKHLSEESASLFQRAFRVRNRKTDSRFYEYIKRKQYTDKDIHYYYHGSRTENFWGLITEGQKLNPDEAVITGKMFGYGLYYAQRAKKSIHYTSLEKSFWAKGKSKTGFLAVYKVVYRNPKNVYRFENSMTKWTKKDIVPNDAVYAHAGVSLLNDEIIVYDEAQSTIQYVLELGI